MSEGVERHNSRGTPAAAILNNISVRYCRPGRGRGIKAGAAPRGSQMLTPRLAGRRKGNSEARKHFSSSRPIVSASRRQHRPCRQEALTQREPASVTPRRAANSRSLGLWGHAKTRPCRVSGRHRAPPKRCGFRPRSDMWVAVAAVAARLVLLKVVGRASRRPRRLSLARRHVGSATRASARSAFGPNGPSPPSLPRKSRRRRHQDKPAHKLAAGLRLGPWPPWPGQAGPGRPTPPRPTRV